MGKFEREISSGRLSQPNMRAFDTPDTPLLASNRDSHSRRKNSAFLTRAKGYAIIITAIGTAIAAFWGAFKKPEEKIAIAGYNALKERVEKQGDQINQIHDDITSLHAYLKAMQEIQVHTQTVQPVPTTTHSSARPAATTASIAAPQPMASDELPKLPVPSQKTNTPVLPEVGSLEKSTAINNQLAASVR